MSLRYTGEATMDEPTIRDVERWKDKIEVRLDNRQVFFLFFGSAMVACMLFVLGVIVGKRLETRGRAEAPVVEDPLAVLDRFGTVVPAAGPAPLTFPRALIGDGSSGKAGKAKTKTTDTDHGDRALDRLMAKPTLTATAPAVATIPTANTTTLTSPAAPVAARPESALPKFSPTPKSVSAKSAPGSTSTSTPIAGPAPVVAAAKKPAALPRALPTSPVASKEPSPTGKVPSSATKVAPVAAAPADKSKGHYLLQLSSFQDRTEADAFARRFGTQKAYVVATEIPGKGTWYRVRVGSYGSLQEATTAKSAFEHDHNVIAYVAGGGPAK
jgi:DedD protein